MADKPVALVTGANKGIGLQIAKDLSAHGFTVLIGSRRLEQGEIAAQATGNGALAVQLDVTDQASITAAADRIAGEYGRLDLLVNNAAIAHAGEPGRPLPEVAKAGLLTVVSLDELRAVWEANVFGVIALTQAMLPLLRRAPLGRIVNISSGGGSLTRNSDPANPHRAMFGTYSSSKAALNAVTVGFAAALDAEGIKVHAVDPGFTRTDLNNNQGTGTVEEAAREAVRVALLGSDSPTGTFSSNAGPVPW